MKKVIWQSRTKNDLIVEVWQAIGGPAVGAAELKEIQGALNDQFGEGAVDSPAAIARVLADEGAELRHPEVVEFDAGWREAEIEKTTINEARELFDLENTWNLKMAGGWIRKIERLRKTLVGEHDRKGTKMLEDRAKEEKRRAQVIAANAKFSSNQRAEAAEIAEWLTIWLQQPGLFEDWLALRQRTPEFREKLKK